MTEIAKHIVKQWGSSRAFRIAKRAELQELLDALDRLRVGCAYFPGGSRRVEQIANEVKALRQELSVKEWGR